MLTVWTKLVMLSYTYMITCGYVCISGVRYSNFSYHDIGAISITIRYISRYNLWFEITMKHYYEDNALFMKPCKLCCLHAS